MFDIREVSVPAKGSDLDVYKKFIHDYQLVYPFLRVVNSEAIFSDTTKETVTITSSGWFIHDYDDALAIYSYREAKLDEEFIREHVINVAEFSRILSKKKWIGIELIDGSQLMKLLLGIESDRYNFNITNCSRSDDDRRCYKNIVEYVDRNNLIWDKRYNKEDVGEKSQLMFKSPMLDVTEQVEIPRLKLMLDLCKSISETTHEIHLDDSAQRKIIFDAEKLENEIYSMLLRNLEILWVGKSFDSYIGTKKALEDADILHKKDKYGALKVLCDGIAASDRYIKSLTNDIVYLNKLPKKNLATEHLLDNLNFYKDTIKTYQRSSLMNEICEINKGLV